MTTRYLDHDFPMLRNNRSGSRMLIKDAGTLETAHAIEIVAFDRTGTHTAGEPTIVAIEPGVSTASLDAAAARHQNVGRSVAWLAVRKEQHRSLARWIAFGDTINDLLQDARHQHRAPDIAQKPAKPEKSRQKRQSR